jgi:ferrous iron transport protein B
MPDYRVPTLRNIFHRMWERGREFLLRAGTVILAFSILIWSLLYFPRDPEVKKRPPSPSLLRRLTHTRRLKSKRHWKIPNPISAPL